MASLIWIDPGHEDLDLLFGNNKIKTLPIHGTLVGAIPLDVDD